MTTASTAPDDPRTQAETILKRIGGAATSSTVDIAEGAVALAAFDRPRVPLARYLHHLEVLAGDLAEAAAAEGDPEPSLDRRARLLARVMA